MRSQIQQLVSVRRQFSDKRTLRPEKSGELRAASDPWQIASDNNRHSHYPYSADSSDTLAPCGWPALLIGYVAFMQVGGPAMVRFGIVGCGYVGRKHIQALEANGDRARVVAVCDADVERAREAARIAGCRRFYTNLQEMLASGGLDAVSVCTPSGLHSAHGKMAADAGLHVVCEKPLGLDLVSVDGLLRASERARVKVFTVYQLRLTPAVRLLKRAVESGALGRLCLLQATVMLCRPQEYFSQAHWRGTRAMDGGALFNQASHFVDLLLWLGGQVVEVGGRMATLGRDIETEDTAVAWLAFESGAIGSLTVTLLTLPKNLEGSLTVVGDRGTVKIAGRALDRVEYWHVAGGSSGVPNDTAAQGPGDAQDGQLQGHSAFYANVLDVLDGKAEPVADGAEGRKSVETIVAIHQAHERGVQVRLPLS